MTLCECDNKRRTKKSSKETRVTESKKKQLVVENNDRSRVEMIWRIKEIA